MNPSLLRVLRIVIRADSDPARQALFANLTQSRRMVRAVWRLHERVAGTQAAALLVGCYGLASFLSIAPPRDRRERVLTLAVHENARRQVAHVASWIGVDDCASIPAGKRSPFRSSTLAALASLVSGRRVVAALRVIRTIDEAHGFLVGCRAAEAIAWYARTKAILAERKPGAVLVSSDSNPEEAGFTGAARALDIPQVFVSHAYPTPNSPPLDFSLSILEGEAAVEARSRKGPIRGEVVLAGVEGDSAAMDPTRLARANPVIGIFTPKAISWRTLTELIDDCRDHFHARRIVIRWHPSMLERPRLRHPPDGRPEIVETPRSMSLTDVARQCDWVIADENSNVHLPVLRLGIPTIAVKQLGVYPPSRSDQYGFAANGIVFPPVTSMRDVHPDAVASFFCDGWAARFRRYDAAYLRPCDAIRDEVRTAVRRLLEPVPAPGPHAAR